MMDTSSDIYLLQGFFFFGRPTWGIDMVPTTGAVVVVRDALFRSHFAGVLWREDGTWTGEMSDRYGPSLLFGIEIGDQELSFAKQYHHRNDVIQYDFSLQDEVWVGGYKGYATSSGGATCLLTPTSSAIFGPGDSPLVQ